MKTIISLILLLCVSVMSQPWRPQGFTTNRYGQPINAGNSIVTNLSTVQSTNFSGNGANLTNLNASNLASGSVPSARIVALPLYGYDSSVESGWLQQQASGVPQITFDGDSLTNLNATELRIGTIPSARYGNAASMPGNLTVASNVVSAGLTNVGQLQQTGQWNSTNSSSVASGSVTNTVTGSISVSGRGDFAGVATSSNFRSDSFSVPALGTYSTAGLALIGTTMRISMAGDAQVLITNGNARFSGTGAFTNGVSSYSTSATNTVNATGWTNTTGINFTAYVTATAISFTINNATNAVLYTSPTLTATMPVHLQPGWSVRAASGLGGVALPD